MRDPTTNSATKIRILGDAEACEAVLEALRCGLGEVFVSCTRDAREDPDQIRVYAHVRIDPERHS